MPENNLPSAKPDPEIAPGEFDFAAPITERPRVKRRALQEATTPPKKVEAISEKTVEPEARPAKTTPSTSPTKPASSTPSTPYISPATKPKTASSQPTSPHGTRPATLYYSSGSRQDKETAATTSPMKTTPSASPSPTPAASATTASRPAAATTRAPSVSDYRSNAERQSREQKSVGDVLSVLVYTLMAVFVLGFSLAGYGAYVITKQLDKQSVTMSDFDKRYASDYTEINSRLTTTQENLTQAQAQLARQQELIVKQQDAINKLIAALDDNTSAIKQERATRAQETANLRSRLKDLEYQGPSTTTRKY